MKVLLPLRSQQPHFRRVGGWLPQNSDVLVDWVRQLVKEVDQRSERQTWTEPIQELSKLIEGSPELRMLASAMFDEVPNKPPYSLDPIRCKQVQDYKQMLDLFNCISTSYAPKWSCTEYCSGLIGFPFNAILDWPMATQSGYAFFLRSDVNAKFKVILNSWFEGVLNTKKSLYVITTDKGGWLSEEALKAIEEDTNVGDQNLKFEQLFICDPAKEHWGFQSWDQFFVRGFNDINNIRPVYHKDDATWVVSACESKPFSLQTNVNEYDSFWLKGQPYSVVEMLNHCPEARTFVGGTVYQAFLSPTTYHRWHSPVTGTIVYASVVDGAYFSEPTITGFNYQNSSPDPAAPDLAQGYITHVATRAIILIDAGEILGLVGVILVGMADVSTCEIFKNPQDYVEKGEEIGMFHHGGSTHCLLFKKELELEWVPEAYPGPSDDKRKNIPVRSALARVRTK